jgi:thiol-disulfide isomerase/thioredoxin
MFRPIPITRQPLSQRRIRRRSRFFFLAGVILLALPATAPAQSADPQAVSTAPENLPSASGQPNIAAPASGCCASSGEPASLGELARLARAKKSSQPKAAKIFDDDNMPRAPLRSGEKAPEVGGDNSLGGGKVMLIDFWASWCGPCRESLPGLKQLEAVYRREGFEVISVSEDEDESAWRRFINLHQMSWTQRLDSNHRMARQFGASALPTYILIGRDGTVVQQYVGHDPNESVVDRIGPDLKKTLDGAT